MLQEHTACRNIQLKIHITFIGWHNKEFFCVNFILPYLKFYFCIFGGWYIFFLFCMFLLDFELHNFNLIWIKSNCFFKNQPLLIDIKKIDFTKNNFLKNVQLPKIKFLSSQEERVVYIPRNHICLLNTDQNNINIKNHHIKQIFLVTRDYLV